MRTYGTLRPHDCFKGFEGFRFVEKPCIGEGAFHNPRLQLEPRSVKYNITLVGRSTCEARFAREQVVCGEIIPHLRPEDKLRERRGRCRAKTRPSTGIPTPKGDVPRRSA